MARAVADKKLRLDDDIREYLPGDYPNLVVGDQPIRILHLANQTPGLPQNPTAIPEGATAADIVRLERANGGEQFFRSLHEVRLDHAPGAEYRYSNAGYALLGLILERVYHLPFEDLVRKFIGRPLRMRDTSIQLTSSQLTRFAPGYADDVQIVRPLFLACRRREV